MTNLWSHHEIVLEIDGEAVPYGVACERALGLREGARRGLVRDAGGHALIEGPHVPLDLAVDVVEVAVREDEAGERAVGGVGDEAVDAVGEPGVGPLEDVRQVPAAVPLVLLEVVLDVARGRPEDVLVVADGWVSPRVRVRAAAVRSRIGVWHVGGVNREGAGGLRVTLARCARHDYSARQAKIYIHGAVVSFACPSHGGVRP